MLSNCVGPLAEEGFEISAIPKGLDPADIARHFGGHLVVPCYMEAQGSFNELLKEHSDDIARYHSQGVQNANVLTWLTHEALASGSYLPLPVDSRASKKQALKKSVRRVIGLVWSKGNQSADDTTLRVWLYVVLKNEAPLLEFAKLAAG